MSFPYISYESSYKKKLEELEKENEELRNRIKQLEANIQKFEKALYGRRSEAKEVPFVKKSEADNFVKKSEADKIAETLGVIASCYPNFSEAANILSSYKDESLPKTPKECEEYLTNFKINLYCRWYGRTRRLRGVTDEYLKERIYPKLREIFEKDTGKVIFIDDRVDVDEIGIGLLIKNIYELSPRDYILISKRTNPISLSFKWRIFHPYEDDTEIFDINLLKIHWILLNEDPALAIFGKIPIGNNYFIGDFILRPLRRHEAEEEYEKKLNQLEDISIPYDDVWAPSSEDYKEYSKKILYLVENTPIKDLEEVVSLGNVTRAREMEYVLPDIALKIRKGKVHKSDKELIEMDEDAYTYKSYWTLFRALTNASKDVYEKLMRYIQS